MGRAAQTRWAPRRLATATMIRIQEVPRDAAGLLLGIGASAPETPLPPTHGAISGATVRGPGKGPRAAQMTFVTWCWGPEKGLGRSPE